MNKLLLLPLLLFSAACFGQTVAFQVTAPSTGIDANSTVIENAGTATITVLRTGSTAAQSTVDVIVGTGANGGNATIGTDFNFTTQTLTFPAGSTAAQTFTVSIIDNSTAQPARYAVFQLTNASGATIGGASTHILFIGDNDQVATPVTKRVSMQAVSSYLVGAAGTNSAEIVAYDPTSKRLFVANSIANKMEVLDFANPASITSVASISLASYGPSSGINSVAVRRGSPSIVAVGIESVVPLTNTTNPAPAGKVVFFDTNGGFISQVDVGVQPDMVGFSPDGKILMTADEGEPNNAYTIDPPGTISIIDVSGAISSLTQSNVATLNFNSFDSQKATLQAAGVRIYGPNATVSQDFEPEYVTFSADSKKAWVSLQENNAIAVVDLVTKQITSIVPLGLKDHSLSGNTFDASDQVTGNINLQVNWPVKGMYQPDQISYFEIAGTPYIITANEGDSRAYTGYNEEIRVSTTTGTPSTSYDLNTTIFPNAAILKRNSALGRLQLTNANINTTTNKFDEIQALGGRSFSILNANTGAQVFDSGNLIEKIVSEDATWGPFFNADHSSNTTKNRSDNKGPEPESVVVNVIGGRTYAFIVLERVGGVMAFDITNPTAPVYCDYLNTRSTTSVAGDRGAEGIIYITPSDSPTGAGLIVVGNEISSTVSVYSVNATAGALPATAVSALGFTANWNAVSGATSYLLDISSDNFSTFLTGYNGKSTTALSEVVTGLQPNTAYQYRLRAVSSLGNSAVSNVIISTTLLSAPVATAATAPLSTGFTANWNAVTGATSYLLDVSADNFATFVTGFNALSVTGTSSVITGLTANTAYSYRLRAVNTNGNSANSNVISVTTVVTAPVAIAATSLALTAFTANWNAVIGATGYLLDVSTDNFATFVTGNNARSVTGTTATVTGLTANTAYSYRVRATNTNGTSSNSNVISATTLAITRIVGTTGTLAFGDVIVGEAPNQKSFTITNSGNSDLSVTGITVPTGYTVTPTTGTVTPAGTLNVQVTFNPAAPQDYNGNATIASNSTSGTSTIAITGRGVKITAVEDLIADGVTVYPNPVKGIFTIKCKDAIESQKQVRLFDETGREFEFVSLQVLDKTTLQADISNLPNGLYLLKMDANKKSLPKKIVKAQN